MNTDQETCQARNRRTLSPDTAAFRDLVEADVRGTTGLAEASSLRSPETLGRWITELRRLQTSLAGQSTARTAEAESITIDLKLAGEADQAQRTWSTHRRWIASIARFGTAVDETLLEAEALVRVLQSDDLRYCDAIERHRREMALQAEDPCEADLELWAVLSR